MADDGGLPILKAHQSAFGFGELKISSFVLSTFATKCSDCLYRRVIQKVMRAQLQFLLHLIFLKSFDHQTH